MAETQVNAAAGKRERLNGYLRQHLAFVCRDFADIQERLYYNRISPQIEPTADELLKELNLRSEQMIDDMGRIIRDLKE